MQTNGAATMPLVITVTPQTIRHRIVCYGQVRSSNGAVWYLVKATRRRVSQRVYTCTCSGSFLGGHLCQHIAAFKLAEAAS